jgi:hypothetical protein
MTKKLMAKFLAKKEMARIERGNNFDFLKKTRKSVFDTLVKEGLISKLRFHEENVYFLICDIKKDFKIKLCFNLGVSFPIKELCSKSRYIKASIYSSVKEKDLLSYLRRVINSRIRGFSNEDSFEKDVLPEIRRLNRVSHANRLSVRADFLEGVDFEVEYYTDRYYTHKTTLKLNVKSSENFLQKSAEKYPNVYNIVYKKGDSVQATLFKIKRLMVMKKALD